MMLVKPVLCAILIHVILALDIPPTTNGGNEQDFLWIFAGCQGGGPRKELCSGLGCGVYAKMG